MRSYAITALIGTGLFGLAPQAQAASHARPAHPQPDRPGAQNAAHARPADQQPQAARPAIQTAGHAQQQAARPTEHNADHAQQQADRPTEHNADHAQQQADRPAAHTAVNVRRADAKPQADRPAAQNVNVRSGDAQPARAVLPHPVRVQHFDPQPQPVRPVAEIPVQARPGDPEPVRPAYAMHITGQGQHWEVSPGELQTVRWTLTNTGNRPLEHAQLVASIPAGWSVREGQGCTRRGQYLGCDLGGLEPGRSAAVVVPMVAQGQAGPVRLAAWSRATAGSLTIPGPTTSFRVQVKRR
jgi:hypothetical protein